MRENRGVGKEDIFYYFFSVMISTCNWTVVGKNAVDSVVFYNTEREIRYGFQVCYH